MRNRGLSMTVYHYKTHRLERGIKDILRLTRMRPSSLQARIASLTNNVTMGLDRSASYLSHRPFSTRNDISKQKMTPPDASMTTITDTIITASTDIGTPPKKKSNTSNEKEKKRPRGWKLLLGDDPMPDILNVEEEEEEEEERGPPQNVKEFLERFREAGRLYVSTWEGFSDNYNQKGDSAKEDKKGDDAQDRQEEEESSLFDEQEFNERRRDIRKNVRRNVETLREEGNNVLEAAKDYTGIHNKVDLKKWAMKQLVLANECVAAFMKGYRKGRDDEMDKMLHEYFQDIEDLMDEDVKKKTGDNTFNGNPIQITPRLERRRGTRRRKRRLSRLP